MAKILFDKEESFLWCEIFGGFVLAASGAELRGG